MSRRMLRPRKAVLYAEVADLRAKLAAATVSEETTWRLSKLSTLIGFVLGFAGGWWL